MLDFIPFACAGRKMTYMNHQSGLLANRWISGVADRLATDNAGSPSRKKRREMPPTIPKE